MSALQKALDGGIFGVTAELTPPKGYDFTEQLETAELLRGRITNRAKAGGIGKIFLFILTGSTKVNQGYISIRL